MEDLAAALLGGRQSALLQPLRNHAERSLFNILGNIIGAVHHPAVGRILALAAKESGPGVVQILGRDERADPYFAALTMGLAGHVDDFDDTHLATVIHPGAIAAAAALAVGPALPVSGGDFLAAFAVGCETQLRLGVAVSPSHYSRGWHITGTCGVIGAAATAGLLLGLDERSLALTLSLAAGQTLGHREGFGTEVKAFHAGQAAANGVLCAFLARDLGARGSIGDEDLVGRRELLGVLADTFDDVRLDMTGGVPWELSYNAFKPYPCGVVAHPGIDAARQLHLRHPDPTDIVEVRYRCHPLVPELMGTRQPADGLEARFSAVHGVAAGLVRDAVGLAEYEDAVVSDPELRRLRSLTTLIPSDDLDSDAAAVEIETRDGRTDIEHVEHARGSRERPLTDEELRVKVRSLVEPVLPGRTDAILSAVRSLADRASVGELLSTCASGAGERVASGGR